LKTKQKKHKLFQIVLKRKQNRKAQTISNSFENKTKHELFQIVLKTKQSKNTNYFK